MIFEFLLGARQAGVINDQHRLAAENRDLKKRIELLERQVAALTRPVPGRPNDPST